MSNAGVRKLTVQFMSRKKTAAPAAKLATREMIDFLVAEKGIPRDEAYILCSLAVDLHVTQLVDQTKGVHAMLPKAIFR